jgi:hypothetical protein
MAAPRRRIVRPPSEPPAADPQGRRRLRKPHGRLEKDRAALARWTVRLKRAFHEFERLQRRVAQAERVIAKLEGP